MKPSEFISNLEEALSALAPVLDELSDLVSSGSLGLPMAQVKASAAVHDHFAKLGDGHLLALLVQYLPQIISILGPLLGGVTAPAPKPGG